MLFIMPNEQGYIGRMTYVERLRVPLWWWLIALLLVATAAVAILAYVPPAPGFTVLALFAVAVGFVVFSYGHTAIRVSDGALQVGRNAVAGEWIGSAEALDRAASAHALSAGADTSDLLLTRPYIGELVRVSIADAADPHAHWLVSSRQARKLAEAVRAISGASA